jgi:hypothetical protein
MDSRGVHLVASSQQETGGELRGAIPPATHGSGRLSGPVCLARQVFAMRFHYVTQLFRRDHGVLPSVSADLMDPRQPARHHHPRS